MSITKIIKKFHSNRVQNIKNMPNGIERDLTIGSLVADLGKRSISAVCKAIGCCFRKVKKCYDKFINGIQLSIEFRGRKRIEDIYPNIINDIESVIEKHKNVDPSFKTERLYVSINPTTIIDELVDKFNYPPKFASYNTINRILKEMGYKIHKIPKSKVIGKIPETDAIFENVNNEMESALKSNDETSVMYIDDKASNPEFPNIISYKTAVDRRAKDICGFYDLFYTLNYIKYIINERDNYYLYKNTNKKSFFKFYKNFLPFFIQNMPSLEDYEIKELNNESSLERHHLDFILKNKILFKYMGKNYDEIMKKYQFEFEWFDFMGNNFAISEIEKIKKLDNIFNEIFKINIEKNPCKKIFFLYIGLTEHWILIIYDSLYKNSFIKMDSFYGAQDIINLKYLDEKEDPYVVFKSFAFFINACGLLK